MHLSLIVYFHLFIHHWLADYHMKNVLFCRVQMVSKGHLVQKEIWYDTFYITFPRELYFLFISVNYMLIMFMVFINPLNSYV